MNPSLASTRLTETEWQIAKTVCTPKQLEALNYWRHGYGYKRISIILTIPRDTTRGRIDRARETLKRHLATSDLPGYNHDREAA